MFQHQSEAVYVALQESGAVDAGQLEVCRQESRSTGQALTELLFERDVVTRSGLLDGIASSLGCERVLEMPEVLSATTVGLIDADCAHDYGVVPLRGDANSIDLLAVDPFNPRIVDDLSFTLGRGVRVLVAEPEEIQALIKQHYGGREGPLEGLTTGGAANAVTGGGTEATTKELEALAAQTPVIRFVTVVLNQAIRDQASDIHFEPFEHEFKIRYRIDGALYEMTPPPKALALPITSRIKVLANLNIAERRIPQDGRIKLVVAGRSIDLRVSTLPTQFGESVVVRVLDQAAVRLDLSELGMPAEVLEGVRENIRRPNGIFLVTGPTGSGKTTTLYSALRAINSPETKILTAEDPVEYEIEGIMQVPVNPLIGFTFASALRSFLRQDPDVIMVGEIRDAETAQIAIQASLTGHLVLSTLHTNDAAGAVSRLSDIGIEPFLIANTVEAVLAQRLLRRVCGRCRHEVTPSAMLLQQSGIALADIGGGQCFEGRGCEHCAGTGYRGRVGIFEWLPLSDSLRELVMKRAPGSELQKLAVSEGMVTLRQDALRALRAGETSLAEVIKYT